MASIRKPKLTPEEYLDIERKARFKSEYLDGEVFAMSGASERHNSISGNCFAAIHAQVRGRPCRVYVGDMRVRIPDSKMYSYPDVVAMCAQPELEEDEYLDTLLNPAVIIEVLSDSTEAYDRGEKFARYRTIPSLVEYLLVSQHRHHLDHFVRQPDNNWLLSEASGLGAKVGLTSIGCSLMLADVYEKVEMDPVGEQAAFRA